MKKSVIQSVIGLGIAVMLVLGGQMSVYGAGPPRTQMEVDLVRPSLIGGFQVSSRLENDRQILSAAGQCLREGETEGEFRVVGRNYTPEGSVLKAFYGDDLEYSSTLERQWEEDDGWYQCVRFAVKWVDSTAESEGRPDADGGQTGGVVETPEGSSGTQSKQYWRLGDVVTRELGGEMYTFRCIDQNYQNVSDAGQTAALFLCDSVIPADTGAYYAYERQEDGSYGYVYHPGEIRDFGDTNVYKYSRVRQWLEKTAEDWDSVRVDIGVGIGYTGKTENGAFEQLNEAALRPSALGYQQLTGQMFVLSVEEALEYRQYLWRFGVDIGDAENPETQIGSFSKGYWLRTPYCGALSGTDGIQEVYVVDLVTGTIRPQAVTSYQLSGGNTLEESKLQEGGMDMIQGMSIGVRPAFALPQQG